MMKKPRLCTGCGKPFEPMSDAVWNAVLYGHRRTFLKHPKNEEYLKRITEEYEAGRKKDH
ncbi:hypothetical protein D4R54_00720 [archaeon]|nr:MAG: hypothetical protein D4R54_00720 [archaeon]